MAKSKTSGQTRIRQDYAVAIFTKNEEANIEECIKSFSGLYDVYVIDSQSTDRTCELAFACGAQVFQFHWDGKYPRKKQWTLQSLTKYRRIIMFDADLRATAGFLRELDLLAERNFAAASCPISYYFQGRRIRFGVKVRYFGILDPEKCKFPDIEIYNKGYGDIEFHYQPEVSGDVIKLKNPIVHRDNDPLWSWVQRHERYAFYQSELSNFPSSLKLMNSHKTLRGKFFSRLPFKSTIRFFVSYFLFLGFLDGVRGFRYQWLLSQHHYLTHLYEVDSSYKK